MRIGSDTSKNKYATEHFHAEGYPLVQSFEPGEDWIFCYVDNVVMGPRQGAGIFCQREEPT